MPRVNDQIQKILPSLAGGQPVLPVKAGRRMCGIPVAKGHNFVVRLSRIHDQVQEIALKKVSGTLEASEYPARASAAIDWSKPGLRNTGDRKTSDRKMGAKNIFFL